MSNKKYYNLSWGGLLSIIGVIFLIGLGIWIYSINKNTPDNIECGEAVKYQIISDKPFLIMINDFPLIKEKGKNIVYFPICEEEKVYCFNNTYEEILNPEGILKEGVEPNLIFIANASESIPASCYDNNCIYEKVNILELEC